MYAKWIVSEIILYYQHESIVTGIILWCKNMSQIQINSLFLECLTRENVIPFCVKIYVGELRT